MTSLPNKLSLPSLAVGLLAGTVLVTACPLAAEEGLEWLDSDSSAEDEPKGPEGLVVDAPDPLQSTNRTLLASEDSSRYVGGVTGVDAGYIASGPVFVTDLMINSTVAGSEAQVWFEPPPPLPWQPCSLGPTDPAHVLSSNPATGMRYFVPAGNNLCHEGDPIRWSGYAPYY